MLGALRHPQFRRLWIGETASSVGDRMAFIAVALLVAQETGSAADVGIVLAARAGAFVLLTLLGGVVADRLPRRAVILGADAGRFVVQGAFAVALFLGDVSLAVIAASQALVAAGEAFFIPAYSGLVPQTVPEEDIQPATAATSVSQNAAEFGGPALAALLIATLGAPWAFALDAVTFLVSFVAVLGVRPRTRGEPSVRAGVLRELAEGFSEVRTRAWVWVTISVFTLVLMLSWAPVLVLGPLVARDEYGGEAFFGVWQACFGGGVLVASLALTRIRLRRPLRAGFLALLVWPLDIAAFALGAPPALLLPLAVLNGLGIGVFDVGWVSSLAQHIPPRALSRVSAFDYVGSLGLVPIGYLLAGPLGEAVGGTEVLLGGAGIALVLLLVGLAPRETRALRQPGETLPA